MRHRVRPSFRCRIGPCARSGVTRNAHKGLSYSRMGRHRGRIGPCARSGGCRNAREGLSYSRSRSAYQSRRRRTAVRTAVAINVIVSVISSNTSAVPY